MEYEQDFGLDNLTSEEYTQLTAGILTQHRGTMLDVAKGVFELTEDLNELFGKDLQLAEVREDMEIIRGIEHSLDEFFTDRLTLRLLISHVHGLSKNVESTCRDGNEMVGVVNVNTQPITIL